MGESMNLQVPDRADAEKPKRRVLLVCGGRTFGVPAKFAPNREADNARVLEQRTVGLRFLNGLHLETPVHELIHGGAAGADDLGGAWAASFGGVIKVDVYPADWQRHGKKAGFLRNLEMVAELKRRKAEGAQVLVVAFSGSNGTAHMCKVATEVGLEVVQVEQVKS